MNPTLSEHQVNQLRELLARRYDDLREEVRQELLNSDNEQYIRLTSGVNDPADDSVADLLADLDLAMIDRHINEIREIEAALLRIAKGTYGICSDDEEPIEYARLSVNPTARRCFQCQSRYEGSHAYLNHATL